ncbi:uncharacterized protein BDZ83DRAFT_183835 [Colletotrichum acutatum]|uniref:Uncharacterized protein n=1 Tax=Glomerella acutata TaxID=27357 RepID=A0AAD8XB03_GLOAC|nr:uncharacterized protein BDZ83DRAFT_183835 [Colletotrichum acutatum]KAK1707150.1 hypothetical protein BDZ83DRAFT_183835 [Colletotrichum acutatum]
MGSLGAWRGCSQELMRRTNPTKRVSISNNGMDGRCKCGGWSKSEKPMLDSTEEAFKSPPPPSSPRVFPYTAARVSQRPPPPKANETHQGTRRPGENQKTLPEKRHLITEDFCRPWKQHKKDEMTFLGEPPYAPSSQDFQSRPRRLHVIRIAPRIPPIFPQPNPIPFRMQASRCIQPTIKSATTTEKGGNRSSFTSLKSHSPIARKRVGPCDFDNKSLHERSSPPSSLRCTCIHAVAIMNGKRRTTSRLAGTPICRRAKKTQEVTSTRDTETPESISANESAIFFALPPSFQYCSC